MDAKDALANAQHAMKLADDWLGVPMVCTMSIHVAMYLEP